MRKSAPVPIGFPALAPSTVDQIAQARAAIDQRAAELTASNRFAKAPDGFLWGAATSGHQTEGGNVNSDGWLNETVQPTVFAEPSGDACDSYHRYPEDIAIAAGLGLNCYRLGLEWARIEPEDGRFSMAALDHYARMLRACREQGLTPIVTLSHFTVPRWFAMRGGFEVADGADRFARFAERVSRHLGPLIGAATPFNEANIARLLQLMPATIENRPTAERMIAAAAQASGSPGYSSLLFAPPDKTEPVMLAAHAKAYQALKAGPGDFPVGVSLSIQEFEGVGGGEPIAARIRQTLYGAWFAAAAESDFIGVQTYTRVRIGAAGPLPAEPGAEITDAGYEFCPEALDATIRLAAATGKPVYVTENGIATRDDSRRAAFIERALDTVRRCLADGIDVRSYIHWSLLDNFEWSRGFQQRFGLVGIAPDTFERQIKPSALLLGAHARANLI